MEDAASSNAALMRRIVQLENERDDLRRDVETLCMQQSGNYSGGGDIMSRLQARRVAGLEQELESYRQKISLYKRENDNLQEELSEVYHIKGQFADLYKAETEKNKKVEEEIKFFQSKVAASLAERDRLSFEIEKVHSHKEALEEELRECHRKCKESMRENEEQLRRLEEVQANLQELNSEAEVYHQVIERFWQVRENSNRSEDKEPRDRASFLDMAASLLADPEGLWEFGDCVQMNKQLEMKVQSLEATTAICQEDYAASKAVAAELQLEVDKQAKAREQALECASAVKNELANRETAFTSQLQELKRFQKALREDVDAILTKEMKSLDAVHELFQETAAKCNAVESSLSRTGSRSISESSDMGCSTATSSEVQDNKRVQANVNQDVFLQALHEKVAALMLLSQEEERHLLQGKTTAGLECQLKELNERLLQVTQEKVKALMEVAELKYECQELKDRERDLLRLLQQPSSANAGGRLLPANWVEPAEPAVEEGMKVVTYKHGRKKHSYAGSYIKSWLRGVDLHGSKTIETNSSSVDTSVDIARSRIETAALQERITSLQQLIKAANRLRATLAKAAANEACDLESLKDDLIVVKAVCLEAQRLKVALSCTLPVSWAGEGDKSSLNEGNPETHEKSVLELVSAAGMALVELLVSTAELQKASLTASLYKEIPAVSSQEQF